MSVQTHDADLQLHVSLKDRDDLSACCAVQGTLFDADDADESVRRGYRGTVACKVAGITYRQLDHWARKHIVEPSIAPSRGSGSRRLYSFKDILILSVSKKLLDAGVNLQNVTAAITFLSQRSVSQLEHVTIMCDSQRVYDCIDGTDMLALLERGEAVFGISISMLWHHIEQILEQEDCVEFTTPVMPGAGGVIDELTAMRMRKKLQERHVALETSAAA